MWGGGALKWGAREYYHTVIGIVRTTKMYHKEVVALIHYQKPPHILTGGYFN